MFFKQTNIRIPVPPEQQEQAGITRHFSNYLGGDPALQAITENQSKLPVQLRCGTFLLKGISYK